jgi:hypothetical protein
MGPQSVGDLEDNLDSKPKENAVTNNFTISDSFSNENENSLQETGSTQGQAEASFPESWPLGCKKLF